ncbi:MAG TPA: tetratricopeptide repeat protein [Thermoanaerobaculia bacterium]|jgi:Tfp pilus assembly protein PilF
MKQTRRAAPAAILARLALMSLTLSAVTLASCGAGQVNPEKSDAQLAFGIKMARRGLWSEALFRFQQAERREPGNPRMLNNMAVAYEALGQFDVALDYYQRALKASPADGDLRRNYSRFVEFYRNFRAETAGEGEEGVETGEATVGEDDP